MSGEGAAALIGALNKVIKFAVGAGVGASVLQTSLFTGEVLSVCALVEAVLVLATCSHASLSLPITYPQSMGVSGL